MAQGAGIQLEVGLDLAYFRNQLVGLQAVTTGTKLSFGVTFKRLDIQNELNALATNIKKRNYFLEVKTNLGTEIENAKKLATALDNLARSSAAAKTSVGQRLGVGAIGRAPSQGGLGSKDVEKLYRASARAGLLVLDKEIAKTKASMVAAMEAVGVDSIAGLLNGLDSQNAKLKEAAQSLGKDLLSSVKTVLGIASPSKKFEEIGKNVGEGFEKGALSSMDNAFDALESKMRQRGKILDTVARGIFRMLGMDPAAMLQQARQQRLPSAINWQATTPPRQAFTGPSSSGRALPPGPTQAMLPGTSFGRQKYLPTALSEELKKVLRDAANAFVDTLKTQVRTAKILDLGRTMQPSLAGSRIAGLLPAAAGRTPSPYSTGRIGGETQSELFARREREARMRSALRGVDVMAETPASRASAPYSYANRPAMPRPPTSAIVPYSAGGSLVPTGGGGGGIPPRPPSGGGGRGMGGMANFGNALSNINLPGAGAVREIGEEFGMAAKQVLLFGTAYKALAFITSFPAQVGQAVGALQSFNNTLKAISPTAEEAKASNQFILDIVDRYNVPLQSARNGFTKLYASMAPAGFKGDEIRDLFASVSQAAATFGMSADKVDRVNYAFAQMASKGQVMSEELKGQLGDVLPGAMGIFAEAAGFQGPDAIQKFSKALEDGAFKGEAMRQLLKNVTIVMTKEFGPGAEGAARTFQGVINRMQNSTKLLYEAFEPVAVGFLNSVVVPLTSGIKIVADGFNAFFTGVNAKTSGGFAIAQELEKLKPTFEGIRANVTALLPTFKSFANTVLGVGKVFLQIAGNPFVGYLARVYLNVLALTTAIQLLNLRALIPMIANFARSLYALVAFAVQCVSTGTVVQRLGMAVQVTGLMLRTFFATTGIGLVLVGIGLLTERFMSMNQALADTRAKALGAADAIRAMSQTEARQASQQYDRQAQSLKGLSKEIEEGKMKGKAWIEVTKEQAEALKSAGITVSDVRGSLQVQPMRVGGAYQKVEGLAAEARFRVRGLDYQDKQVEQQTNIPPIAGLAAAEGGATGDKAAQDRSLQMADDRRKYEADLMKLSAEQAMQLDDMGFEYWKSLQDARYDYLEIGQNEWMQREIKFQRDLQSIEIRRIEAIRKAQQESQKAEVDAVSAAYVAGGSGSASGQQGGGAMFGSTGRVFNAPGWVHGHFQNADRQALVQDTTDVVMSLLQSGTQAELGSGRQFKAGMTRGEIEAIVKQGVASHKQYASGVGAIDVFVPQGTQVPVPLSGVGNLGGNAGYSGNLPRGSQLMHLDPSSKSGATGTARARTEAKQDYSAELQARQAVNAKEREGYALKLAQQKAQTEINLLIKEYVASIAPVEQLKLENSLLEDRIGLVQEGRRDDDLETALKIIEVTRREALAVQTATAAIEENNRKVQEGLLGKEEAARLNAIEVKRIEELNKATKQYIPSLEQRLKLQKQLNFEEASRDLREEIASLRIINDEERRLFDLRNQYGTDERARQIYDLEMVKQNLEATRALVADFVSQTSGDYKGFLKAVISGEDPVDALKQFQQGLKDRVLTIFFDFTMAPVEKFMKEAFTGLLLPDATKGLPPAEAQAKTGVEGNTVATNENTTAIKDLTAALNGGGSAPAAASGGGTGGGIFDAASVFGGGGNLTGGIFDTIAQQMGGATESFDSFSSHMGKFVDSSVASADAVGSWGDSFNTQLSESLTKATETTDKEGLNFQESLGKAVGAIGIAAGAVMGIAAGISQIKEGGTSNVLGGIGSIFMSLGGALGGFGGLFGFASGGVAMGGIGPIKPFAKGGTVSGPTLGLIGEGKYNEAIVPLPDGKSIPVQMRGPQQSRDLLADQRQQQTMMPSLSMSFQTSTINGVEYVSRDQLEQAMAATRRQAARDGAQRGMDMTLDKIQNSPSTRSRIGVR